MKRYIRSDTAQYKVVLQDGQLYQVDDFNSDRHEIIEVHSRPIIKTVKSLEDASKAYRDFIDSKNLRASECTGGIVLNSNDEPVAYVSYNGKVEDFYEFIRRWGKGIVYNSRVLKSLGYTPEDF